MKKRIFPLIITLAALAVSGSAAFYSVFGLSKLFAGASTQVIIMAGSLEFAKLVVASLLYQYWSTINKFLKGYLMIACFVLMVITSGGIYGFLSGAYQSTATQSELLDKSLVILQHKQERFNETKEDLVLEKTQLNQSISDLRVSLSNPQQVSWFDKNSQTVITSTSSSARRALQAELKTTISDRDNINLKLEAVLDSIGKTDIALLEKEIDNEDQRELGPLKYLANTTGWPMDKVVNYFLLLIIFVFDPLAIALVVAANMAFAQIRKPEEPEEDYFDVRNKQLEKLVESKEIIEDENYFEDLEEFIKYNNEESSDGLTYPQFVEKHYKETELNELTNDIMEVDEKRMDIIGQNGNDGLHYDDSDVNEEPIKEEQKEQILEIEFGKPYDANDDKLNIPTEEDLKKLEKYLNKLSPNKDELYYDEEYGGELDRLTDTTQTLIVEEPKIEKDNDEKRTLTYRKRK